jgi:ABC-type multidrug transport system fused ATPase/permease subunit
VIRNPSLMLLDEATSALDNSTEKRVIENLERQRCTRITVAHRLSTVRNADLIVVMDKGRIVEQGNHHQLIANNGLYARLIQATQNPATTELPHDAISVGSAARHGMHSTGSHAHRA